MAMERIAGLLFSGFMCKLYAASLAVWMASEAVGFILRTFKGMSLAFAG